MRIQTIAAAILAAGLVPARAPEASGKAAELTRSEYFDIIRQYARGERMEAVVRLGAWSERDFARQLTGIEQAARAGILP